MLKRIFASLILIGLSLVATSDVSAAVGVSVHVKLKAEPGGMFLVAKPARLILSPVRVTLGLLRGGVFRTRIFGMGPGRLVFAGIKAKPFHLHMKGHGPHIKIGPGGGPGIKINPGKGHGGKIKIKF
jgi:hypothetical protein